MKMLLQTAAAVPLIALMGTSAASAATINIDDFTVTQSVTSPNYDAVIGPQANIFGGNREVHVTTESGQEGGTSFSANAIGQGDGDLSNQRATSGNAVLTYDGGGTAAGVQTVGSVDATTMADSFVLTDFLSDIDGASLTVTVFDSMMNSSSQTQMPMGGQDQMAQDVVFNFADFDMQSILSDLSAIQLTLAGAENVDFQFSSFIARGPDTPPVGAVPVPPALGFSLAGLGLLAAVGRRRRG